MEAAAVAAAEEVEGLMCRGIQVTSLMRDPLNYFPYVITLMDRSVTHR